MRETTVKHQQKSSSACLIRVHDSDSESNLGNVALRARALSADVILQLLYEMFHSTVLYYHWRLERGSITANLPLLPLLPWNSFFSGDVDNLFIPARNCGQSCLDCLDCGSPAQAWSASPRPPSPSLSPSQMTNPIGELPPRPLIVRFALRSLAG